MDEHVNQINSMVSVLSDLCPRFKEGIADLFVDGTHEKELAIAFFMSGLEATSNITYGDFIEIKRQMLNILSGMKRE